MGVHHDLKPAWVGEGENEIVSLSVEICVEEEFRIRCVVAYGPQETGPSMEEKLKFWAHLDTEVEAADKKRHWFYSTDGRKFVGGTGANPRGPEQTK